VRSSALAAALIVVLAAGCGQESSDPSGEGTNADPPPASTQPMPNPPVTTETLRLDCEEPVSMQVDHLSDVGGDRNPVAAARAYLGKRLQPDDRLGRTETASGTPLVRVVRTGKLVAAVYLVAADNGWLVNMAEMCPEFLEK
jgi:hypothetical protein